MDFLKDLWGFMKTRKKFWLLPIILTLLFFGILIVLTSGSAIAPFIYTIF
jgi:Family of unknown function (DUF5989)